MDASLLQGPQRAGRPPNHEFLIGLSAVAHSHGRGQLAEWNCHASGSEGGPGSSSPSPRVSSSGGGDGGLWGEFTNTSGAQAQSVPRGKTGKFEERSDGAIE